MKSVRAYGFIAAALLCLPAVAGAQVVINEIRIDGSGSDDQEYFELAGPSGTSIANHFYIVIGDGTGGSGVVENVTALAGSIGGGGFYLVVDTGSGSNYALGGTPDIDTALEFENSDNVTHFLVTGFTGAIGDDLDTNDDGVLDITPWASIVDSVAIVETFDIPLGSEHFYSTTIVGPDGTFVPGTVKRCPDIVGGWEIGSFGAPLADSPDAPNQCPEVCDDGLDNDSDGQIDCADSDCAGDLACAPTPPNDLCANAIVTGPAVLAVTTAGAFTDGPIGCGGGLENDVWYLFQAPCSGPTTFTTCGTASSGFNPQLAIYDATAGCPTADDWLVCDAGSCVGSGEPTIIFETVAGQDYYVQIGGFQGTRGTLTLTIECPPLDCHVDPNPNFTASYVAETGFANAPAADIGFVPALDSILVGGVGTIEDVDVRVDITHPFLGDLIVELIGPNSTQIRLHENSTSLAEFDMGVRFDDEGAPYGTVPFFGGNRMQPFEALSVFDGTSADGSWAITALDVFLTSPADPPRGTLDSWEVIFFTPLAIPDGSAGGLIAPIEVPASNTDGVLDLDATVSITHPNTSQLTVTLQSPAGTSVTLHAGGPGTDIDGRYDDDPLLGGPNDGFGTLIPDGPGILADFDGEFLAGTWTLTAVDSVAGTAGTLSGWDLLACPAPCVGITDLVASSDCATNSVTLGWLNGDTYTSIEILRDGATIATIAGTAQTYVDTAPLEGFHEYTVRSLCAAGAQESSRFVNHYGYAGEAHIVLQLEGLVDFGDTGAVDSGAAIEAALLANGLTSVRRVSIDPDAYPCLTAPTVDSIWVAAGTFPFNYLLQTSEGDILGGANAGGIALYLESADHWGFSHDVSSLDGRDGVADSIHNGATTDGDDTFTAMDGLDGGFGLDLSGFANVAYGQDNIGFDDFTDQLQAAAADAAGPNAGAIWRLDDALGTPYVTGIHYDTSSGGKTIAQSWEFGGFGGDQAALMQLYIDALGLGGVTPGGFRRGDCNTDGLFNIADAVSLLGELFSGGTPGSCADACDMNDDGAKNIADAIFGLARLFSGGPPPPAPFPDCGPDATSGDALDCASYPPAC